MPYKDRHGRTCGFLDVEHTDNSNHFVRRYFILNRHMNRLYYYMDNPQNLPPRSQPVGCIELSYVSMVSDTSTSRPKLRFGFFVAVAGDRHHFLANDRDDCIGWVAALKDATKIVVPKPLVPEKELEEEHTSYRAEVFGGVVVKTPLESGKSSVSRESSMDETDSAGSFYVLGSKLVDAMGYPRPSKCGSDSDYDSSCDEALGRCNSTMRCTSFQSIPIKTGYCIKQGHMVKTWKRRYFVLDEDGLSYYKTHLEKLPIRTIPRADIVEARMSIGIHLNREFLFEVVTAARVFYGQTNSPEERDAWISAINYSLSPSRLKPKKSISKKQTDDLAIGTSQEKEAFYRYSSVLP